MINQAILYRPGVKLSGITSQICTTKYRHDLFLLQRYPVSYRVAICYWILYQMFGCTYYLCYIIQGMLLSTILYECIILECTGKNYYKYICYDTLYGNIVLQNIDLWKTKIRNYLGCLEFEMTSSVNWVKNNYNF